MKEKRLVNWVLHFEIKDKNNLKEDDWEDFYIFYKNTYDQRFQPPYLNRDFFDHVQKIKKS